MCYDMHETRSRDRNASPHSWCVVDLPLGESGCMAERVGQILGNYQLLRLLGRGAFAEVYLAEHRYLEVPAAIKVLHVRMESNTHEQFLREARTIAHLQHPHIVRVLDFGFQDQTPFLVMEYLPNGTLRTRYPTRRWLYWFYRSLVAGLVGGIIGVLAREFVGGLVEGLIIGLAIGMIVGLAGGLLGTRNTEIYSAEVAVWSWSQMWRRLINFLIAMLVFCLLFGLVIGLFNGALIGLAAGLLGGVLGGLPRALFGGLSKKMLDEHDILRPNQGIWRAAWNAVRFGLAFGLLFGLLFWMIFGLLFWGILGPIGGLLFGLAFGLFLGPAFGLIIGLRSRSGGLICIQHVILRILLWRSGSIPWNYPRFLDYAAERILLRKVGGGYIFVHRLLLDYFASLDSTPTLEEAREQEQHVLPVS